MEADRKEFHKKTEQHALERQQQMMPMVRMLAGAAPVMQAMMTESDAWNRYLAILQGFLETIKKSRAMAQDRLSDPTVWEPYQLVKLKSDVLQATAMIEALETAIQLPKALLEGGEAAKEIISKFEAQHETTSAAQP